MHLIDQTDSLRPAHTLTGLDALIGQDFVFHAAPVKVVGAAAFPVRAYAVLS